MKIKSNAEENCSAWALIHTIRLLLFMCMFNKYVELCASAVFKISEQNSKQIVPSYKRKDINNNLNLNLWSLKTEKPTN